MHVFPPGMVEREGRRKKGMSSEGCTVSVRRRAAIGAKRRAQSTEARIPVVGFDFRLVPVHLRRLDHSKCFASRAKVCKKPN